MQPSAESAIKANSALQLGTATNSTNSSSVKQGLITPSFENCLGLSVLSNSTHQATYLNDSEEQ
jgi:hypothetical protein